MCWGTIWKPLYWEPVWIVEILEKKFSFFIYIFGLYLLLWYRWFSAAILFQICKSHYKVCRQENHIVFWSIPDGLWWAIYLYCQSRDEMTRWLQLWITSFGLVFVAYPLSILWLQSYDLFSKMRDSNAGSRDSLGVISSTNHFTTENCS